MSESSKSKKTKRPPPALKRFQWKRLSTLRNIQFLRISYAVLVVVPLIATVQSTSLGSFFQGLPLTMRLGYLASLLLSLAHMIYQGYCPQIIQRFESPNDLYRDMLEIKALQTQHLASDTGFTFDIAHCRSSFMAANHASWGARLFCGLLYWGGVGLVLWVILERSLVVVGVTGY
jgi:hypothetical protein